MRIFIRLFFMILCGAMILPAFQVAAEENSSDAAKNGWYEEQGKQYYYRDNQAVKGWLNIDNNWYYFNQNDGAASEGWVYDKGKWYFLKSSGVMQTGWLLDKNHWYYLNSSGAMQTGWLLDKNHWYYLNSSGAMQTGWLLDKNHWYYLNSSGAMQTGWLLNKNHWYYLNSSGAMQTGWLLEKNHWYYLNPSGAMQTGWVYLNSWYYLNRSGVWVPNTIADGLTTVPNNNQLILVTSLGYNTNKAKIRTFEKEDNKWYEKLNVDGFIGKEGFATVMNEGAKKSPRGKYTIGTAFGRFQNPGTKLPYRQITSDDVWVDDSNSSLYNTWQKASENRGRWNSAEKMDIAAYNYGFVINYNTAERIPGAGSAIFFHVSNSYTLGCTGTAQNYVVGILKWLDPSKSPVIIQTPEGELNHY
ncbi:cell wall-binding protein [Neobacillus sp. NPDC058068]|uniref:cell wall-binding protein n=1 Tax=Neobacillus sp. NPDC058068 TaxID=3346325 RepID=UPI0036D930D1